METFDAVIVGGGPAGSACAWTLTHAGLHVAVLDRAVFPRDKVCGGWISLPVVQLLALNLDEYRHGRVLQPILGFRTGRLGHRMIETRYPEAVSFGIRRYEFDHYLLQRSGAHLWCGRPVSTLRRLGDRWIVNDAMATPVLVGAGGHFCPVARWLNGPQPTDAVVAALEIELQLSARQRAACRVQLDTPELYFCEDLKGYGWCFRKADFLNVGLGRQDPHRLPEHAGAFLACLKARQIVPQDFPAAWKGHAYLVRGSRSRQCIGDGVVLVGDAAGLADPRSGEGIRPAIESGRLAALTILAADGRYDLAALDLYQRRLQTSVATGRPAGPLAQVVPAYARRRLAGALLESPWFTRHVLVNRWFLGGHSSRLSVAAAESEPPATAACEAAMDHSGAFMNARNPVPVRASGAVDSAPHPDHWPAACTRSGATVLDRWLLGLLQRALNAASVRIVLWDGTSLYRSPTQPVSTVELRDRATLIGLLWNRDLSFGEAYSAGHLEVHGNLVTLLEAISRARESRAARGLAWLRSLRPNTRARSRHDIHHHYDLGNDFYRMWLDDEMVYTCAYFLSPEMSLEEAQLAKMRHVCRKLRLQPGERVIEAGPGWGSLALYMARHYGVSVRAYNISREQTQYARERARREGLTDRVEFVEDDYRAIKDRADVFVSVGMLEHVGLAQFYALGEVINTSLDRQCGRGLLHFIGRDVAYPLNMWIRKRIFPGAYPPTLSQVTRRVFEPWGLSVLDVENLRPHYARTLAHWRARFDEGLDQVRATFDEPFVRAWRLYLAGSQAAFTTGWMQLFQVTFARGRGSQIPWSRG